jgi:aminoglycoside phosphotransferase (APT) family kinase protein
MQLSPSNAVDYLRARGFLADDELANARELVGGVSNEVILVSRPQGDDVVLKQVREQLNVAEPWYCSVERVWREIAVLRQCERLLTGQTSDATLTVEVPYFLFEDRGNYLYAMSAAPTNHVAWKNELLSGIARTDVAHACGTALGTLHAASWHDAELAQQFDDRQFFDDLRIDPYYRQVTRVHPELSPDMDTLIDSVWRERHCLVHGDFSPKNLLVHANGVMLIDFEVGHYGDPAFDLGFFLTHLFFKAFHHVPRHTPFLDLITGFWDSYAAAITPLISANDFDLLRSRGIQNLAGCTLARLVGKSKIDYLNGPRRREALFDLSRFILTEHPDHWTAVQEFACRLIAGRQLDS